MRNKITPGSFSQFAWRAALAFLSLLILGLPGCAAATSSPTMDEPTAAVVEPTPAASTPAAGLTHVVDTGETCNMIAFQYGVNEADLIRENGLAEDCSDLWVGQVLRIPRVEGRLDLAAAETLVRAYIFRNTPGMNPGAVFPLDEITPPDAWERMGAQVFKVRDGARQFQSYAIVGGVVAPVGESFGGLGINSMAVSDLDSNGGAELLYAYGYGSGISQSSIGMLRVVNGRPVATELSGAGYRGSLVLTREDDQTIYVDGKPDQGGITERLGALHMVAGQLALLPVELTPEPEVRP